jgi:two-component system, chemotaxis family, response regulator PixG
MRQSAQPQHIFVVNNTPAILDLVRELLKQERYRITTTNFLPRTFDEIAALQPTLLIIDLSLGEQEGWQLLAGLRQEASTRGIPVLVFSTTPHLLEEAAANQAVWGGDRFLSLPFALDDLLQQVRDLIGVI